MGMLWTYVQFIKVYRFEYIKIVTIGPNLISIHLISSTPSIREIWKQTHVIGSIFIQLFPSAS